MTFQVRAGTHQNSEVVPYDVGLHYKGTVMNDSITSIVISIFEDNIIGVLMMGGEHYNFGKYETEAESGSIYVLAQEQEPGADVDLGCETLEGEDDFKGDNNGTAELSIDKLVKIYMEVDYDSYLNDFGSNTTAVSNYVTGFFANVAQLYQAEQINVVINELFIWTSPDPLPHW
jgi:hypothetical protein